jgi:hypothetical protein
MADITGTNGNDTLTGTNSNDIVKGLNGNDKIIGSLGSDIIDGGTGKDILDYSKDFNIDNVSVEFNSTGNIQARKVGFGFDTDQIANVEEFIGIANKSAVSFSSISADTTSEIDIRNNRLTYYSQLTGNKTFSIKNFSAYSIFALEGRGRIIGSDLNDSISIDSTNTTEITTTSNNTIVGSKGNDVLGTTNGNINVKTTIDYSSLDRAVTILPKVRVINFRPGPFFFLDLNVGKGDFGTDTLTEPGSPKFVGASNKSNKIDASSPNGDLSSLDINLAKNSLVINRANNSILLGKFEIINFTDVVGSKNNDTIVGANKNGKLTGGGGNDTITGGNKNDIITGSDSTARGVGEVDTLTGGGGRDKFVLGDANGAYYVGKGKDDYATITDFNLFQDSIDLGGFKDYSFGSGGNNTIELYSGKDVNNRDLIAKIQLAGGISAASSNSRSIAGSSSNLDSIIPKIDIVSGSNSGANT